MTLLQHEMPNAGTKDLLRFITCGSVDDGKSTLIGRLLHDSKLIFEDQLSALTKDSRRHGTTGEEIDFALLLDGLEAEREQGITIDVAYRFFATARRAFIVADTPGHEQYTRNMATGASNAQLAVILIDARKGVLTQTRRHSFICSLLGVRHVVIAVNKIDLVKKSKLLPLIDRYRQEMDFAEIVPVSATTGKGVDGLVEEVVACMPEGPRYYPEGMVTDVAEAFWVADLVREELLHRVDDELPHSIACRVTEWEWPRIRCEILVERDSQKGIVIGKGGAVLKQVGTAVRRQLPPGAYLELFVRVEKRWQQREDALDRLGL